MFKKNVDNQKNEVRNHGNRRYTMLLLALLFIGTATYGTYAYFTDSTSVNGNIKLKLGTVNLGEATTKTEWTYVGYGNGQNGQINKIQTNDAAFDFVNVQPGDQFTKEVTVSYEGTLDGTIEIENTYTDQTGLTLEAKVNNQAGALDSAITTVSPGEKFTVTLTATVPVGEAESFGNDRNIAGGTTIDLTALAEAVTITATQNK